MWTTPNPPYVVNHKTKTAHPSPLVIPHEDFGIIQTRLKITVPSFLAQFYQSSPATPRACILLHLMHVGKKGVVCGVIGS